MTFVHAAVRGPRGTARVKLLVDSGAVYTLLPTKTWQRIGLEPERTQGFTLADGTDIDRSMADCRLAIPQGETYTPVILGEPGDEGLLGMVTLEALGLMLNPLTRDLQPMRLRL
jgi:predicted aspartyl protease